MRILLAEDEKDLNKIITARLKDEYYSVDSCFDGKEAEEYLTAVKYDAVILDIMMPKKDGLSVLEGNEEEKGFYTGYITDCKRQCGRSGGRA
mgnify:FL=1